MRNAARGRRGVVAGLDEPSSRCYSGHMRYTVGLKPRATKDLRRLPRDDARRIFDALKELESDLSGDVRRLTNFTPEYSLRVGVYRVLFEIEEGNRVIVYRVRHRREAYRRR